MEEKAKDAVIFYEVWFRDCDLAEGTEYNSYCSESCFESHYEDWCEHSAEGPCMWTRLTRKEFVEVTNDNEPTCWECWHGRSHG